MTHLSERELAERWRCSTRHVRQQRYERRIDFIEIGRRVLYPIEAVERFERENTQQARCVTLPRRRQA